MNAGQPERHIAQRFFRTIPGRDRTLTRPGRYLQRALRLTPLRPYDVTISHSSSFIWYRVPKVASRALLQAFDDHSITCEARHPAHVRLPLRLFDSYFAWAIVRHPVDRLESCWRNKVRDRNFYALPPSSRSPEGFLEHLETLDLRNAEPHVRLQSRSIDLTRIDFLGRMENLASDLGQVFAHLDVEFSDVPVKNATEKRDNAWSAALRQRAAVLYALDMEIFGYE
ncbi:MAG: sulfotransferase family 2 domain-containing protein [Acidimicrobiales bacterium]